jgi:hypothetical protein
MPSAFTMVGNFLPLHPVGKTSRKHKIANALMAWVNWFFMIT